eukprot:313579_1
MCSTESLSIYVRLLWVKWSSWALCSNFMCVLSFFTLLKPISSSIMVQLIIFLFLNIEPNVVQPLVEKNCATSVRSMSMMIQEGVKIPLNTNFMKLIDGSPKEIPAQDVFSGKKVVVCGVPGALTPVCSEQHLPGFIKNVDNFKRKGVDTIACISVNDPFVMSRWSKDLGCAAVIEMLGDGGTEFSTALGLTFNTGGFGGTRLRRLSMLIDDGVVKKLNVVDGGEWADEISAEHLLNSL